MKIRLLCIIFPLMMAQAWGDYRVTGVIFSGNTADVDLSGIGPATGQDLTEKDIRSLIAEVTDRYHRLGYTAAYVESATVRKDGILLINIREGRIAGVVIKGEGAAKHDELKRLLLRDGDGLFNDRVLKERSEEAATILGLRSLDITPERTEAGDVLLIVMVRKKGGAFSAGISTDMIYGITPSVRYVYPFSGSTTEIQAIAGYRDGLWRRAEGDIRFSVNAGAGGLSLFMKGNGGRFVDTWESKDRDYRTVQVTPAMGLSCEKGPLRAEAYISRGFMELENYGKSGKMNDSRVSLNIDYSTRGFVLDRRDGTMLGMLLSGGRETLSDHTYAMARFKGETSFLPLMELRLVPRFNIFYTTSRERFFWSYVYDSSLVGFFGDYTASGWKNTAGLDAEVQIYRSLLYAGPFVNSGYFRDEERVFRLRTGAGMKGSARYERITFSMSYAWDIRESPRHGGAFFSINGNF